MTWSGKRKGENRRRTADELTNVIGTYPLATERIIFGTIHPMEEATEPDASANALSNKLATKHNRIFPSVFKQGGSQTHSDNFNHVVGSFGGNSAIMALVTRQLWLPRRKRSGIF